MVNPKIEALRPRTLGEALEARAKAPCVVLAGGTDLMVRRRSWSGTLPQFAGPVLFVSRLAELMGIREENGVLVVGAGVCLAELGEDARVPALLRQAARSMAAPAIRNVGTLGGNLCNASPAGDTLPPLYALGASVVLRSVRGERGLPLSAFITGPGRTALAPDELLTEVRIPASSFTHSSYRKVGGRKAQAISKLSFAAAARVENGAVEEIRIAIGAVAPTVVRLPEAEAALRGRTAAALAADPGAASALYDAAVRPIDDQRSTAAYRKQVALGLIRQFVGGLV